MKDCFRFFVVIGVLKTQYCDLQTLRYRVSTYKIVAKNSQLLAARGVEHCFKAVCTLDMLFHTDSHTYTTGRSRF